MCTLIVKMHDSGAAPSVRAVVEFLVDATAELSTP